MKTASLILVLFALHTEMYAQCKIENCFKFPIKPEECLKYCKSYSSILRTASSVELKLIAGFDSEITQKILEERKNNENLDAESFFEKLSETEKKSLEEGLLNMNESKEKYFLLEQKDRRKVIKQLEKIESLQ